MSNLRLINKTTPTSVSSFEIKDVFSNDYDTYKIIISDVDASASNWSSMRFLNSAGTALTTSYNIAQYALYANSSETEYRALQQSELQYIFYTTAAASAGIEITVFKPANTTNFTFMYAQSSGSTTEGLGTKYLGCITLSTAITGFSFRILSGIYNSLTVATYGLRID